ncbi:RhoGAP-domain-containing protein [Colletotrichum somersetense]|nr:RhoGAP-domain-containing protein [Colletotrichum somersetense]
MSASGGSAAAARAKPNKGAPRNSSMDSAISAISTKSQSQKGTAGTPSDPTDIAALIKTAGSPEAVIQYLLKEKQSQSQQNAQLWRLVDKQRAMILGLNKDLERALKDKEKYRKKLKEVMSISEHTGADGSKTASKVLKMPMSKGIPAVDVTAPKEQSAATPDSPTLDSDSQKHSPVDMAMAPYPITPPADQPNGPPSAVGAFLDPSHEMPKAHEHAYDRFNHDAEEHAAEMARRELEAEDMMELPISLGLPPSRSLPSQPPSIPPPKPPVVSETVSNPEEGLSQFPAPPPRKPPPAPLQLQGPTQPSRDDEDSESDFDDLLEVTEILTERRGRRRTREEDDRDREILAAQEAERRSLSKKSQTGTPTHVKLDPPTELPQSPAKQVLRENVPASLAVGLSVNSLEPPLLSPGLPSSPRPPGLMSMDSPAASISSFPAAPLSPRPPRQPIPLPPGHSIQAAAEATEPKGPEPLNIVKQGWDSSSDKSRGSPTERGRIFKGFTTEEYPDLLLPPNVLPSIIVKVASSRMKPSRASLMSLTQLEEDPVFTLAVFSRSEPGELWRVEKDSASLAKLDQRLKQCSAFTAKTPERSLFSGHAPAKLDARRTALDRYLEEVLETPLDTASALELCKYLSTNTLPPNPDDAGSMESMVEAKAKSGPGGRPFRTGYLTKRGKNFGGWKARFFVLDGPHLKYYETPGGAHLGTIKLPSAQIGKQSQSNENQSPQPSVNSDDTDNQYRHAFLILEPKKKDSSSHVKHVLCAENDKERDQWVDALLRWIDYKDPEEEEGNATKQHAQDRQTSIAAERAEKKKQQRYKKTASQHQPSESENLIGVRYDATSQGDLPHHGGPARPRQAGHMPENHHPSEAMTMPSQPPMISAPRDMQVIADTAQWGNKTGGGLGVPAIDEKKIKKRSFFGFGPKAARSSSDGQDSLFGGSEGGSSTPPQGGYQGPIRQAFGAPLAEAVRFNPPTDVNVPLPAVVYRCIQYLDAKNAILEEGIFRLSGSNIVIKQLRERFNIEGDVNLVTDETYYDIHAVASLLKLYLRELPTTILTRDLHIEFMAVTEMSGQKEKIAALSELVQRLPQANATLLKYLIAFLIKIINNADMNKMTVRNVGIVFSPTLNIPAPVFAMLLQNYYGIFGLEPEEYELPSSFADADSGRERSGSLPSMNNGFPNRPAYDTSQQHGRPSTSAGSSQSPHRQRLLDSRSGQQRTNAGTPPPLLQDLQNARSSPTPPPNFPTNRPMAYEPQYMPQSYQSNGYHGSSRGYDGGAPAYDQPKRRESAIFMGNMVGLNPQSSKSRLREETQF